MKLLPLAVLLVVAALAVPATAVHSNTRVVAYTMGAGFSTGAVFLSTINCTFYTTQTGCIGGGFPQTTGHPNTDFANGYEHIIVNVNDAAFGLNVGSVGCLKPSWSDTRCSPDDPSQRSCGLTHDLRTYGEFRTTFAAVFVWTVFFDSATSQTCLSSTGSITAFFSNS